MTGVTVIILTFNEDKHLARCLAAIAPFASRVVVVDSFSTDRTLEIARAHGIDVLENRFVNYATQFQWALDNAQITTPWVMRLDADEVIEPDLAAEIIRVLPTLGSNVAGINLKRKHIVFDRWIKHGGRYPLNLLRIWRAGQGRIENRWMDEHIIVWGGETITLDGGFADHNLGNLSYFIRKHDDYATREAIDVLNQRYGLFSRDEDLSSEGTSVQAAVKRWIKERVYNRLPFWLGPLGYFLYRYFFQFGFLDGRPGLVYHFLQGFWYRFLVGAKVYEFDRTLAPCPDAATRLAALRQLTGKAL
ncbi:glycosyltransferase family 2 protein [Rhizobium sp. SGZ-381]|uniref:glycosyltransferase family 2 protein n=1 Tax=Rhizobium sp. SGZ-381 TaxID=3342800 RepID=UPI003671A3DF